MPMVTGKHEMSHQNKSRPNKATPICAPSYQHPYQPQTKRTGQLLVYNSAQPSIY
jgi:hypothetical protein